MRLVLSLVFVMFVLQTVLPPSRDPGVLAWLACGMLAGLRRKPSVRQRVLALTVLVGVWTVGFMALFVLFDPRAPQLSESRLVMLGLSTAWGGLLGSAAAFVGLIFSSGWPSRTRDPAAPLGASALRIVFEKARDNHGDEGRVGVVEAAGHEVDASWIGRHVLVLDPAAGDRITVPIHGVIAIDLE